MIQVELKDPKQEPPKRYQEVIDFIREVFEGETPLIFKEKWKEDGMEEVSRYFTLKTIRKFPEWTADEVTEFVGVDVKYAHRELKRENQQLPEYERNIADSLPDLYGDLFNKEIFLEKGRKIKTRAFTLKTLQKFPDWSDAEVADFVGVTVEYVQQMRQELAKGK